MREDLTRAAPTLLVTTRSLTSRDIIQAAVAEAVLAGMFSLQSLTDSFVAAHSTSWVDDRATLEEVVRQCERRNVGSGSKAKTDLIAIREIFVKHE